MRLLAVHTMGHDTGLCVFEDGRLTFAVETERLTRVRHDHRVEASLAYLWETTGLDKEDVDLLVFSTNVRKGIAQIAHHDALHATIEKGHLVAEGWSRMLGPRRPCFLVAHEASHAALACHLAPDDARSLVLVNEGHGTFSRNSCFVQGSRSLELVDHDALPWYGTGFGWSLLGHLLGLGYGPSAAGTAMALGGHGGQVSHIRELLLAINAKVHLWSRQDQQRELDPLLKWTSDHATFSSHADLVCTFQEMFTNSVLQYCANQMESEDCRQLRLSGGCALNLNANTAIRRNLAPLLTIPPNCNDSGQALGAAIYAMRFMLHIQPEQYSPYSCGVPIDAQMARLPVARAGLQTSSLDCEFVARELAKGVVVALAQGPAELGPRALGNRSLLASTTRAGMRHRLSEGIKGRQWFRPLGCVMRRERFQELYPGQGLSPYMLFNYEMREGLAREATHVDGTSRIQTLERSANPVLWEILQAFEDFTGEAALINTSLNGPGLPIAQSVKDVLADFLDRDVDMFIFDNLVARRA